MARVTSTDGTPIEYSKAGHGPPVILVGDGLDDGSENAPLADRFTVYNYARRGRAGSGDTLPYSVAREISDLAALVCPALEELAPTLAYDAACLGDGRVPVDLLTRVRAPVLVATGGLAAPFEEAEDALAEALPSAERVIIQQGHVADPAVLVPLLTRFFLDQVVDA